MANFKIGQRVRCVAESLRDAVPNAVRPAPIGTEGVVISPLILDWRDGVWVYVVRFDGVDSGYRERAEWTGAYGCEPYEIAPLTDPGADAFIERIKKLAREPAPLTQPERDKIIADDRRADLRDSLVTGAAPK
jgi:hypothetical protein